ncbi:MAG: glycosyltransferase [Bacteroidota bacterium]
MKPKTLFLTRNGLLEPLGKSQILAYLVPLSGEYDIHIVSFEKTRNLKAEKDYLAIQSLCDQHNIKWTPLTYRRFSRKLGIVAGFFELYWTTRRICREENIQLIHARSYYPAFIALATLRYAQIPFIFDMRALWPEELIVSGRLKDKSGAYHIIKSMEKSCLAQSAHIVSLTAAAIGHLARQHPDLPIPQKTSVIPTCTDLSRFQVRQAAASDAIVISCIGTLLSGWFKMNILQAVVNYLLTSHAPIRFELLTRDDATKVLDALDPSGRWQDRIHIESVPFEQMPKRVAAHDGSVFFFNADISKLGSCPTRMGELLAAGIPILANPGVGDVGAIIAENKVGVLIEDETPEAIARACEEFLALLQQPSIAQHCRSVAEELFSLSSGVAAYRKIYQNILTADQVEQTA